MYFPHLHKINPTPHVVFHMTKKFQSKTSTTKLIHGLRLKPADETSHRFYRFFVHSNRQKRSFLFTLHTILPWRIKTNKITFFSAGHEGGHNKPTQPILSSPCIHKSSILSLIIMHSKDESSRARSKISEQSSVCLKLHLQTLISKQKIRNRNIERLNASIFHPQHIFQQNDYTSKCTSELGNAQRWKFISTTYVRISQVR